MGILQELTEKLAQDVLDAQEELGDDRFYEKVSKVLLDASPTTQEAYMTAVRVIMAEKKARKFLEANLKAKRTGGAAPQAPRDAVGH
jgi:Fe-S cluster biosynthesis and repair protein YggX